MTAINSKRLEIVAADGRELARGLKNAGFDPREVLFKCSTTAHADYEGSGVEVKFRLRSDATGEFSLLSDMYAVTPHKVAMPIAMIKNHLRPIGYVVEKIRGHTLDDYRKLTLAHVNSVDTYILRLEELIGLVSELHRRGISHGDLHRRNIMVDDYGIKLIDPLKQDNAERDALELARRRDINYTEGYRREIARLKSSIRV